MQRQKPYIRQRYEFYSRIPKSNFPAIGHATQMVPPGSEAVFDLYPNICFRIPVNFLRSAPQGLPVRDTRTGRTKPHLHSIPQRQLYNPVPPETPSIIRRERNRIKHIIFIRVDPRIVGVRAKGGDTHFKLHTPAPGFNILNQCPPPGRTGVLTTKNVVLQFGLEFPVQTRDIVDTQNTGLP